MTVADHTRFMKGCHEQRSTNVSLVFAASAPGGEWGAARMAGLATDAGVRAGDAFREFGGVVRVSGGGDWINAGW